MSTFGMLINSLRRHSHQNLGFLLELNHSSSFRFFFFPNTTLSFITIAFILSSNHCLPSLAPPFSFAFKSPLPTPVPDEFISPAFILAYVHFSCLLTYACFFPSNLSRSFFLSYGFLLRCSKSTY